MLDKIEQLVGSDKKEDLEALKKNIKDETLKWVIEEINDDEEVEKEYSIEEITKAYHDTKEQIDKGAKMILNKSSVLNTLEKKE